MKRTKRVWGALICLCMAIALLPGTAFALEGESDSYWGHIPENKTFAFADSRYYDGTDYVKVFNVGFYMGNKGQYYTNGDWTDMSRVYRREDYYKNEEFIQFSNTGKVDDPKPDGYPSNDVGGDADGKLPSYNAGTYTTLSWTNFEMYGRFWFNNYGIDSVINASGVATYVEIWKVEPELALSVDKNKVKRGDTFTLTLTINNHFDNMDGLPVENEVSFLLNNAAAASDITKTNNIYTQTFKATEDIDINSIAVKAGVLDTAVNYKEKYETMILAFDEIYRVSYEFVSGSGGKEIPEEIMRLLPKDEKPYENNTIAAAIQPDRTEVKVTDGVWKFKGYDADSKTANANITFVGTWIFTEAAPGETPDDEITDGSQTGDNGNPALWSVLFLLALGGMAGIALHAGKRRTN